MKRYFLGMILILLSVTGDAHPVSDKWVILDNNKPLRSRTSTGTLVDLIKYNASNEVQLISAPLVTTPKTASNALLTNSQADAKVTAYSTPTNSRLDAIEGLNTTQNGRLTAVESLNTTQTGRLDGIDTLNTTQNGRLTTLEGKVLTNYSINAYNQVTTSSTNVVAVTDMTLTPLVTGTYLVIGNGRITASTATSRNATMSLYRNNVLVTGSDYILAVTNVNGADWNYFGVLSLTANQVINIRWFTNAGTIQLTGRSLLAIML